VKDELLLCRHTDEDAKRSLLVGSEFRMDCQLSDEYLFNPHEESLVHELFLFDGTTFHDVPVAPVIRDSGLNLGKSDEAFKSADRLAFRRRFMLVDRVSGINSISKSYQNCRLLSTQKPAVVRYASKIRLFVEVSDFGAQASFSRPYLVIEYSSRTEGDTKSAPTTTYANLYYKDLSRFRTAWLVILVIIVIIGAVLSFVRVWIWSLQFPSNVPNAIPGRTGKFLSTIVYVVIETMGLALFCFLMIFTFYVFAFFKWAKTVYHLLPSQQMYFSDYRPFYAVFGLACALVLIANLVSIFRQSSVDIFFLDWVGVSDCRKRSASSPSARRASASCRASGARCWSATSTTSSPWCAGSSSTSPCCSQASS